MYTRRKIYERIRKLTKEIELDNPLFSFYSEIMSSENTGSMVEHFRSMVNSIIEEGTAIPVPAQQMERRKGMGLPEFHFDREEIKRIIREEE
ncbi:MAG: hypothetical protein ACFFD6_06035 [Candidatus Thorarchaeota archaeon]